MRTAVIGHVEWTEFARVARVPQQGEIVHVEETFVEPAGGGAVAAVQLARLAGECTLYTALGADQLARQVCERLEQLGVRVAAAIREDEPTRRALTYLDDAGERTITTLGARLHARRIDDLPWAELAEVGAVYFVAGDAEALRAARAARAVVASTRIMGTVAGAGVRLDAVVGSAKDEAERYRPIVPPPHYVVVTAGSLGGTWTGAEKQSGRWEPVEVPGPVADAHGCGDSFAAGLAFALGEGRGISAALELAARCGATCLTGHGPYERQLRACDL